MSTARNFEPDHHVDMYQARCTNCGYVETEYGDYSAFDDVGSCIETLEDSWFVRYRHEAAPTPEVPLRRIAHVEVLLCPSCQECEVCEAKPAYRGDDDEHLICAEHEDQVFA